MIENKLYWVRDVTFDADCSQTRGGYDPQSMAMLRNTVINARNPNEPSHTP